MVQSSPGSVSLLPRRSGSTPSVAGAPGKQDSRRKEKHNENERKRREEMKTCYASLAQILPELTPFQQVWLCHCERLVHRSNSYYSTYVVVFACTCRAFFWLCCASVPFAAALHHPTVWMQSPVTRLLSPPSAHRV
jgi:hypothetical protein